MTHVILASGSPSRRRILEASGITPQILVPDVDEDALEAQHPGAAVPELAAILARAKSAAVVQRVLEAPELLDPANARAGGSAVLIASDSILELAGRPVGKPHDADTTRRIWQEMGGGRAELHTAHHITRLQRSSHGWEVHSTAEAVGTSAIHTVRPSPAELEAYIATGEPFEVAGALTIDGYGGAFVTGIEGDHHNVIGLSLPLLRTLVMRLDLFWPSLWDGHAAAPHDTPMGE